MRQTHDSPLLRQFLILALSLLSLVMAGNSPVHAKERERETKIKAAVIFKILKFVDWPAAAWPASDTPLLVCLLGRDPLTQAVADLEGASTQGRALRFTFVNLPLRQPPLCHALVIAAGESDRLHPLLENIADLPTLSFAEIPEFARRGGIVGLVRAKNRFAFEINLRAAKKAGISISAPLLELATIVE